MRNELLLTSQIYGWINNLPNFDGFQLEEASRAASCPTLDALLLKLRR